MARGRLRERAAGEDTDRDRPGAGALRIIEQRAVILRRVIGRECLARARGKTRFERAHTVHENLGRAHWHQGLLMRALDELRRAVSLEPRNLQAKKAIREITRNFN